MCVTLYNWDSSWRKVNKNIWEVCTSVIDKKGQQIRHVLSYTLETIPEALVLTEDVFDGGLSQDNELLEL